MKFIGKFEETIETRRRVTASDNFLCRRNDQ